MVMSEDEAAVLIEYLEAMEGQTDHQRNISIMRGAGYSEQELDAAARTLGKIAGRDYSIL